MTEIQPLQFFAHEVLNRAAEAKRSGDESRVFNSHQMVLLAYICAALKKSESIFPLVVDPIITLNGLFLKIGWTPAAIADDEFFLLGLIDPVILSPEMCRVLFTTAQTHDPSL